MWDVQCALASNLQLATSNLQLATSNLQRSLHLAGHSLEVTALPVCTFAQAKCLAYL